MKKFVTALIALCMWASCFAVLSACTGGGGEHEHSFANTYSYSDTHHWFACTGENCLETKDKAEHSWGTPVVTTQPSASADGQQTVTCIVCGKEKSQPVEFSGLTKDKWQAMVSPANFVNFSLKQSGLIDYGVGIKMQQDATIKFTADKMEIKMHAYYPSNPEIPATDFNEYFTGDVLAQQRESYTKLFLALLDAYDSIEYDKTTKTYKVKETVTVNMTVDGADVSYVMQNGEITVDANGNVVKFVCDFTETVAEPGQDTVVITTQMTWEFFDYGTTVITEPTE